MAQQQKWGGIIAGVSLLFICVATLTPGSAVSTDDVTNVCRRWCDDTLVADFLRNIILFAPFGLGLRVSGRTTRWVLITGSLVSATIEILQIRVVVGRDASVLDWISNSLGAWLGAFVAANLRTILRPPTKLALPFALSASALWLATTVLGAWGLQPAPSADAYYGERTPWLGRTVFAGQLLSARVNGVELPSERMTNDNAVRQALGAGTARIEAEVRAAPAPISSDVAPIARVADEARREILMLGRADRDLVFRFRMRATSLRLETPAFALARVFPLKTDGGPTTLDRPESLSAVLRGGRVELTMRNGSEIRRREFELSAASAWSFFLPWDYWFGPNAPWLSALWLGTLLIPAGYWAAMSDRRRARLISIAIAIVILLGTGLVPLFFRLSPSPAAQFLVSYAGALTGWGIGTYVGRVPIEATALNSDPGSPHDEPDAARRQPIARQSERAPRRTEQG